MTKHIKAEILIEVGDFWADWSDPDEVQWFKEVLLRGNALHLPEVGDTIPVKVNKLEGL